MHRRTIALIAVTILAALILAPAAFGADGDVTFAVMGDNRPGDCTAEFPPVLARSLEEIRLVRPDLLFHIGDLYLGDRGTFGQKFEALAEVRRLMEVPGVPWHIAPGNHELTKDPETERLLYRMMGGQPYYSFDRGGAHFIVLNTYLPGERKAIRGAQLAWLKADLEKAKERPFRFVFMHMAMYAGPRLTDEAYRKRNFEDPANRDELHRLFAQYRVHTVFCGHEHVYYREERDGVRYIIAGGAGANVYAEPQDGGFNHYIIASIRDGKYEETVVQPYQITTEYGVDRMGGSRFVKLHNATSRDMLVRGIRFTVPKGFRYEIKTGHVTCDGKPGHYDLPSEARICERRDLPGGFYEELFLELLLGKGGTPTRVDVIPAGVLE